MFLLFALAILVGSFLVLFGLWFVIWSFTMSSSDVVQAVEEHHSSGTR
jgi:uncharacterized membrane protein